MFVPGQFTYSQLTIFSVVPLQFSPPFDSFLIIDLVNSFVEFPHDVEHEVASHGPQIQSTLVRNDYKTTF